MELCACLWGGIYNPIIPVFKRAPSAWQDPARKGRAAIRGLGIARGYIRFFEPDVYVEAEKGLAESLGLKGIEGQAGRSDFVCQLDDFWAKDEYGRTDPAFGLSIFDVMRSVYEEERRFVLKDDRGGLYVDTAGRSLETELLFGRYPAIDGAGYLERGFKDAFAPQEMASGIEAWKARFADGRMTPLALTRHTLEEQHFGHEGDTLFFFDPSSTCDVIDVWNARLEGARKLPVPIQWAEGLLDELVERVSLYHRPIPTNPSGLKYRMTLEFARSLHEDAREALVEQFAARLPNGSFIIKHWRTTFWEPHDNRLGPSVSRRRVFANESNSRSASGSQENELEVATYAPDFAERFGGRKARWATAIRLRSYRDQRVCTSYPFNTFDRTMPLPMLGRSEWVVGSEGFIALGDYTDKTEFFRLDNQTDAIINWLKHVGVEARMSDAGRTAEQMLATLPRHAQHMFAHEGLLHLLNGMANRRRVVSNEDDTAEHEFGGRHRPYEALAGKIAKLSKSTIWKKIDLDRLVEFGVLRVGIKTSCPHCHYENWHGLDEASYQLRCERCLKDYGFPQGGLEKRNGNWAYRVIGPYSTPDYARGSYAVLLTYRMLSEMTDRPLSENALVFAPSLELTFKDGTAGEADFAAWLPSQSHSSGGKDVRFVIGEAKSFGSNSITKSDTDKLKELAKRLPGTAVIVSVLKPTFDDSEKAHLRALVEWGRIPNERGQARHPVLLLTGIELFADFTVRKAWEDAGDPYAQYLNHYNHASFDELAEATQAIHLGLPPYYEWAHARRRKRS